MSSAENIPILPLRVRVIDPLLRVLAFGVVAFAFAFLINNVANFWFDWPGTLTLLLAHGWFGGNANEFPLPEVMLAKGWIQLSSYFAALGVVVVYVMKTSHRPLQTDAKLLSSLANYIVRAAFWAVLLIGLIDMLISFLRVEGLLVHLVGEELTKDLGRSRFRGTYVHYPLMLVSLIIAWFSRSLGFTWLAVLVVVAEIQIVISRFVFSYEQAFMGDLVRFWYAALFLFASAYALVDEGHVRVDVLYARFSRRGQAWANTCGSLILGLPLCWVILTQGMWQKGSSLNSPLLSFEVSQSGFGMYVKYLMAGFLVIFALSMIVQFCGYILSNAAVLRDTTSVAGHDATSRG